MEIGGAHAGFQHEEQPKMMIPHGQGQQEEVDDNPDADDDMQLDDAGPWQEKGHPFIQQMINLE